MSQITKRALASALKELLEHKPLNKITIADITEQCGVNRQTFYYHFQDIYALLEWIYTTDAQRLLEGKRDGDTWQQGFLQVLKYIRDNRALVRNTYHSVSRELLEGYLYRVTYQLMRDVVEERAAGRWRITSSACGTCFAPSHPWSTRRILFWTNTTG